MSSGDRDFSIEIRSSFSIPHTDIELMRLRLKLTPWQRAQAMIDAREWVIGAIRGRLRAQYPDITDQELTLKAFQEIERVKRFSRPSSILR